MKTIISCVIIFVAAMAHADEKTIKFKVYGNCEMCKKRIETSLKGKTGISYAVWNEETKLMSVKFDDSKISEAEIHKKIAASGYDTEKATAADNAYNKLPECCQYERKKQ